MLRSIAKVGLIVEVVVCFGPIAFVFLSFCIVAIANLDQFRGWQSLDVVGLVVCGTIGLVTLVFLLCKLLFGSETVERPALAWTGAALGTIAVIVYLVSVPRGWKVNGWLALAATAHILYISRRMLSVSSRDGAK